ncbi:hypothetical protein Z196_00470 [Streptococcus pyogenes ABC020046158]|nr:hypothetical protein HKU360_00774 [Streptococcus pyogenes]EZK55722.1 hypothetical protein Z496_00530 [Streptococcus pyogenes ABC020054973]EZK76426.1 hypothetical protein Z461_00531 [Streptococcus pyogenes ABC020035427]EZK81172.1 hypothetical protein Z449_00720 [Streptococcus pyogenes ABC020026946]EZK91821.1 hypothetical protein Z428_00531 [Streptococcus pyogenes ABC020015285]EZK94998.1 hypothetical protein Z420_00721 [Streptococcus pyogenes ABC020010041]EZK98038.1 hypothetical protein Z419
MQQEQSESNLHTQLSSQLAVPPSGYKITSLIVVKVGD